MTLQVASVLFDGWLLRKIASNLADSRWYISTPSMPGPPGQAARLQVDLFVHNRGRIVVGGPVG